MAWLQGRTFFLKAGRSSTRTLCYRLIAAGTASVSQVQSQGEFAQRGSLLDLFPMGSATAYRLDWFDLEIEVIRFDADTQRSQDAVKEVRLLPARELPTDRDGIETCRRNDHEYFPADFTQASLRRPARRGRRAASGLTGCHCSPIAAPLEKSGSRPISRVLS